MNLLHDFLNQFIYYKHIHKPTNILYKMKTNENSSNENSSNKMKQTHTYYKVALAKQLVTYFRFWLT